MKRRLFVYWILTVLFTTNAWSQDTIRVLAIGNSFSENAIENYLYELGQEEEITFVIGNLYIGGCSLERHWNNAKNNKSGYSYRKINSSGKKTKTPDTSLLQGITDENWDYISFQQNSANSGLYETYFPYLAQLTTFVKKHVTNPHVKYIFHQTWAYANDSDHKAFPTYNKDQIYMYKSIVKASRKAAKKVRIKMIVPTGTAIQNGRASCIGDRFCRDGRHLSKDLGYYTAACTWFEALTGKSVVGNSFAPTTITPLEVITVQRAAHQAVVNPFMVTPIKKDFFNIIRAFDKESSTYYFLTQINHKDGNGKIIKLKHAHSIKEQGETVREFAQRVNCTLAFNSSTMRRVDDGIKPNGVQIIDGKIIQNLKTSAYILGIKENNQLVAYSPKIEIEEILNDGVKDALTAFGPLIENHSIVSDELLQIRRNYNNKHPRQVIAQLDNMDILFLSCGGRGFDGEGMTAQDVIRILQQHKVKFAYMLDGGGSTSTVVNGKLITKKIDKNGTTERLRPNFLYFE